MATLNVRLDDKLKMRLMPCWKTEYYSNGSCAITVSVRRGNGAHAGENRHP